jgi:hypothetical protein
MKRLRYIKIAKATNKTSLVRPKFLNLENLEVIIHDQFILQECVTKPILIGTHLLKWSFC